MHPLLGRILVIDGNPGNCTLMRDALEHGGGYTVEQYACAREALRRASAFAPDLILFDADLPESSCADLLAGLRAGGRSTQTPVIFLTPRVASKDLERFKELGVFDVIPRPIDPVGLPRTVQNIWDYYHAWAG